MPFQHMIFLNSTIKIQQPPAFFYLQTLAPATATAVHRPALGRGYVGTNHKVTKSTTVSAQITNHKK
jgi:hypothetical protein